MNMNIQPQKQIKENLSDGLDDLDDFIDVIYDYYENGERYAYEDELGDLKWAYENLIQIMDELISLNIPTFDFINPENLGVRDGVLIFFDPGFGDFSDSNFHDSAVNLDENVFGHNEVDANIMREAAKRAFKYFNVPGSPKFIGRGVFGIAYSVNDRVYKITTDLTEGYNIKNLINKKPKFLAQYYRAIPITYLKHELYFIEVELLETNPIQIKTLFKQLNKRIGKINEHYASDEQHEDNETTN